MEPIEYVPPEPIIQQKRLLSNFFAPTILQRYTVDIGSIIGRRSIMSLDDIMMILEERPLPTTRGSLVEGSDAFKANEEFVQKKAKTFIKNLAANVCQGKIGSGYGLRSASSALMPALDKDLSNYDIAIVTRDTFNTLVSRKVKDQVNVFIDNILGFLIAERGECKMYADAYSVNLICAREQRDEPLLKGVGSILMGLYLYTILSHPNLAFLKSPRPIKPQTVTMIQDVVTKTVVSKKRKTDEGTDDGTTKDGTTKEGTKEDEEVDVYGPRKYKMTSRLIPVQHIAVLELASSYMNASGLCMYSKFGFEYSKDMYGAHCFPALTNLPMIINFDDLEGYVGNTDEENKRKIVDIVLGNNKGFDKPPLCDVKDSRKQQLLGKLKTIQLIHDQSAEMSTDPSPTITSLGLAQLWNDLGSIDTVDYWIHVLEPMTSETTKELDYYIQNYTKSPVPITKGGTTRKCCKHKYKYKYKKRCKRTLRRR
jgi:hypothetical protein